MGSSCAFVAFCFFVVAGVSYESRVFAQKDFRDFNRGGKSLVIYDRLPDRFMKISANQSTELNGTSWQLVKFQGSDDTTRTPDDKTKYTIAFGADGRVTARIDCNRGSGTWKSSGSNQIQFGPLALTRAMCPPGSLHDQIVKHWNFVRSYTVKDGRLFLSLMADGGIYEFEPIVSPASLAGKRWKLTEVNGAPVTSTKAYIEFDPKTKRFSGDGGCNRIAGGFEVDGTHIKFSQAISTRRACMDNEVQQVETNFLKALNEVTDFQIQGESLRLYRGDQQILTFSADSAEASGSRKEAVTGTVSYRQRIALTPGAVVEVKLMDVSRADAPATTIAEKTIKPAGRQVPIAFELQYDPARVNERGRYSIQARILEGGQVSFINSQAYPVITGGRPNKVKVIVNPVSR